MAATATANDSVVSGGGFATNAVEFAAWAAAAALPMKIITQKLDGDAHSIDRVLAIAKAFIIEKGCIPYGGLAIDGALRLKGDRLYPDEERPDYDVYTSRSVVYAYELVDRIHKAGFANAGAMPGIHIQTMRVKFHFLNVADFSYVPEAVLAIIPTLNFQGMKIVHPDYQRMDMHLSLSFPFSNAPMEVVFHRWKKDLTRYNTLAKYYPITFDKAVADLAPGKKVTVPIAAVLAAPQSKETLPQSRETLPQSRAALNGFAAYAVLRAGLDNVIGATACAAPTLDLSRTSKGISFSPPKVAEHMPIVFVSPHTNEIIAELAPAAPVTVYYPYMEFRPKSYYAGDYAVYSTASRLMAVSYVSLTAGKNDSGIITIVSPQYLLLYFLFEGIKARGTPLGETMLAFYLHTLDVLDCADRALALQKDKPNYHDILSNSPYTLTTKVMGDINHDITYVMLSAKSSQESKCGPPPSLRLPDNLKTLMKGFPLSYYSDTAKNRPGDFDYTVNPMFKLDGTVCAPAVTLNDAVIDATNDGVVEAAPDDMSDDAASDA
jgi:hypothetical protein